ncbi:caspase domain-containing protein [Cyathus striatus]|nr:caspase domain-containing protein [Cyathus striatus]
MYIPFLKMHVYTIPQLLWAILIHGLQSVVSQAPAANTVESAPTPAPETQEPPVSNTPEAPEIAQPEPPTIGTDAPPSEAPVIPPLAGIPVEKPTARLFALIIGVNDYKYPSVRKLRGAVPDANHVEEYLLKTLEVPSSQITNLRDNEATRARIIQAIDDLAKDKRIEMGDPILIYYAGHGASAPAPPSWEAGGPEVQMLVPYDFHAIDSKGHKVNGVPDRTLGVLLTRLAKVKGDNISVIFDCCHSGSGTRDDEDDIVVRGIEIVDEIPADLDKRIWDGQAEELDGDDRASAIAAGFTHSGLRSHVLLAACGAGETSKEKGGTGLFTTALLDTLMSVGADKLTYGDLIQRLPSLPKQNPQCEGVHQDRIFFNAKICEKDGAYEMDAGAAHGITAGAQFAVYQDRASSIEGQVKTFTLTGDGYALQVRAGVEEDLRLHVAMEQGLLPVFEALAKEIQHTERTRNILLVEKEKAELDIALEDGQVVFNILNPVVTQFGLTRIPYTIEPDNENLIFVIREAAHFYWHLRRKDPKGIFNGLVDVEFRELVESETEVDAFLEPILSPAEPNLHKENVIDFVVKDSAIYGIKINNKSKVDLFVSVFYFDNSSWEILSYFEPPKALGGAVDPPLLRQNSLTIGYGASGFPPVNYFLRPEQDVDVGFIKLFISTKYIDLGEIPQKSPFVHDRASGIEKRKAPAIWGTILIPVVQRRAPKQFHK